MIPAWRRPPRLSVPALAGLASALAIAAVLVFAGLGDRYLWDDEAENALLARNILETGLPIARDGIHVISQGCGHDADENYLWTFHAWLPMYLAAASFRVFGVSTFAARFPFALLAFLAIPSLYVVGRRLFGDRLIALLACVFLALSVPFLLHARQSRYYAIAIFAGVWMLHFFVETVKGRRWGAVGLVVASTLMLHANHPMFPATLGALLVPFALFEFDRRALVRVLGAAAAVIVVNAPILAIYGSGWTVGFGSGVTGGASWTAKLAEAASVYLLYLRKLDFVMLPVLLLAIFAVWVMIDARAARRPRAADGAAERGDAPGPYVPVWRSAGFRRCSFLLVFVLAYLVPISLLPTVFLRYVVNLMPAVALIQAYVIRTIATKRLAAAVALAVAVLVSDAAHGWLSGVGHRLPPSPVVRWPLALYLHELTHEFDGPIKAIVRHLDAHAKPGDRVYISYGDYPLRFHTKLDVRGGQACESPVVVPPPEWVIVRYFFRSMNTAPGSAEDIQRHMRYVRDEIPWRLYQRIELPVIDTVWENIPEPQWHQFRTPTDGQRVVIHRRVGGPGPDDRR